MVDIQTLIEARERAKSQNNQEMVDRLSEEIRNQVRNVRGRGTQQAAVTGRDAMDAINRLGRFGMGGIASVIPFSRQGAEAYGQLTGRQVLPEPGERPEGLLERGFEVAGQTLPLSLATSGLLAQRGAAMVADPVARGIQPTIDRLSRETSRFWSQSPVTAGASEIGGVLGAGAGMEALSGAQVPSIPIPIVGVRTPEFALPQSEMLGGIGGGVVGGAGGAVIPTVVGRGRQITSRFAEDLFPSTEWSIMNRAAKQLQRDTADPQGAAARALAAQDPITGAQATGEAGLMARQAAVEREFPATRSAVASGKERAVTRLTEEFRTIQGEPLAPGEWQQRLVQATAPEGVTITRGDPDQMLSEAYRAFDPGYRFIDNLPMPTVGLQDSVERAVTNPAIYGGEEAAPRAMAWLNNRLGQLEGDVVTAGDIRRIRTEVRDNRRKVENRSDKEVLDAAEEALTQHLNANIRDPEIAQALQFQDQQYRKHVVLTDAFSKTDFGATPETLFDAIRGSLTRGQVARGETGGLGVRPSPDDAEQALGGLRALGRMGQSGQSVMGDPYRAGQIIRDLPEPDKQTFRAGFVNELMTDARRTVEGADVIDGAALLATIRREAPTLDAMGFTATDKARMTDIANRLMTVQRDPESVAAKIYEDGPSNVLELVFAIAGARAGQRASGGGLGPSLVLAGFGSNLMRRTLGKIFTDGSVEKLMQAAQPTQEGRELYAALLTRPTASIREQDQAARVIRGYMFPTADIGAREIIENFPGE
jgi:hypothetical protein